METAGEPDKLTQGKFRKDEDYHLEEEAIFREECIRILDGLPCFQTKEENEQMNNRLENDKSREGLTKAKLLQPLYLLKPKNNRAIAKIQRFTQLRIADLNELLDKDIQGMILDIDECVAPHHGEVLPENVDHIVSMIQDDIQVVIFSNMKASDRYQPIIDKTNGAVEVHMSQHAKPDSRGFIECCERMDLNPEKVIMVGDNFITDGGAIRAGIDFVKVEPIKTEGEPVLKKLKRLPQLATRWFYEKLSNLYDKVLNREVIRT